MIYDLIIIGAGPAGLTAGIYAQRSGIKTLIIEKESVGGQIASSYKVENYPGYQSISGADLANNFFEQAISLGCDFEIDEAKEIKPGHIKKVVCEYNTYEAKAVIVATGAKYRTLGLQNEDKFIGNGISFCTTCDGAFYAGKDVAVVGGANTAMTNAIYLSSICHKVYLVVRSDSLMGELPLINEVKNKENIEIIYNANVTSLPEEKFDHIMIKTGRKERRLDIEGLFLAIGMVPSSGLTKNLLTEDENGYIEASDCKTNEEGIYAIGDVRRKKIRQVTTACSDGTIAASYVNEYLKSWE